MLRTSRKIDRVAYHQSCKARHVRAMIVIVRWDLPCNLETGIEIGTGWIEGLNWRGGGKGWKRVENNRGYLICRIAAIIVMERVNCENDNHLVSSVRENWIGTGRARIAIFSWRGKADRNAILPWTWKRVVFSPLLNNSNFVDNLPSQFLTFYVNRITDKQNTRAQ